MTKNWILAGALAVVGVGGIACQDGERAEPRVIEEGTGGAGREGMDHKAADSIGDKNGVIDDGEGPLEQDGVADDKIGDEPGVFDDGEGPIEERTQ